MKTISDIASAQSEQLLFEKLSKDFNVLEYYVNVVDEPFRYSCIGIFITSRIEALEGLIEGYQSMPELITLLADYNTLHKTFLDVMKNLINP